MMMKIEHKIFILLENQNHFAKKSSMNLAFVLCWKDRLESWLLFVHSTRECEESSYIATPDDG